MSTTFRSDRAAEAIRETIATALLRNINDPRLHDVTITRCEITPDLSYARLFYTVLGDDQRRTEAQRGFDSANPFLRSQVAHAVPLRVVPELSFRYDKGVDNAQRVEEILSALPEIKRET